MSQINKNTLIEAYLKQRPVLKRFLIARFRDSAIAEDILQEIYLKLARTTLKTDVKNHTAYLFRVANNLALDFRKQQQRAAARDHEWSDLSRHKVAGVPVQDDAGPDRVLDGKKKVTLIKKIIEEMPPQRRRVFTLHKIEGHSHEEVAAQLGVSRGTIEKHMSKALKALAVALNDQADDNG